MKYLIVILISLDSYYFYTLNIALLTYIGAILFLVYEYKNIKIKNFSFLINNFYVNSNITVAFLMSQILSYPFKISAALSVAFNQLFLLIKRNNYGYKKLIKIVGLVLIIHIVFFYIQFGAYYVFGESIDYISWLTSESQRNLDGSNTIFGYPIYRASGLYIEPSTYTAHVLILLLISRDALSMRIKVLTLLSTLLSFSTVGLLYSIIYLMLYEYKNIKNKFHFLFPTIIVLIIAINYAIDRLMHIFNSDYDAVGIRSEIIKLVYKNLSIFGEGIGAITEEMSNGLNVYDSGAGLSLLYFCGIFYFITLYPIFKKCKFSNKKNIFFLFLCKISIFHPFFWFAFSIFINSSDVDE